MDDTALVVTRAAIYAIATPSIVGVVQVVKGVVAPAWHKYAPLLSILLGLVVAVGAVQAVPEPPQPWILTGLSGVALGLSASGLFSGARALASPPKERA